MKGSELIHRATQAQPEPNRGNQLKIDGYYYFKSGNDLYDTFILYRNGVILSGGGNAPDTDPFIFIENLFNSYQNNNSYQEKKIKWGLFVIDNNIIYMEKWHPSSGGAMLVYKRTGEILNDTTFIITKMIRSSTGNEVSIDETFHFKKFSPKPDSTNSFIE